MKTPAHLMAAAWLGLMALASPGVALAYKTSKDAHKACDPKGGQYDAKTKSYCCGTKGGCPNGAALEGPSAAGAAKADMVLKPGATAAPAGPGAAKPAANK